MFAQWLKDHQDEIVAASTAFGLDEPEPLSHDILHSLWENALTDFQQELADQGDQTPPAKEVVQRAQDVRLNLPAFIHCMDSLRQSVQQHLGQDDDTAAERFSWAVALDDFLCRTYHTAGTMLSDEGQSRLAEEFDLAHERDQILQEIIESQQRTLFELSSPIIPIVDGIIVLPLIGSVDGVRARDITRSLLEGITHYKAQVAIIDITGVSVVDTDVAQHLDKTIQAARLKGTHTLVTGISEAMAETIVDLGIDWGEIETLRDLQTGLKVGLQSLGLRLGSVS